MYIFITCPVRIYEVKLMRQVCSLGLPMYKWQRYWLENCIAVFLKVEVAIYDHWSCFPVIANASLYHESPSSISVDLLNAARHHAPGVALYVYTHGLFP